MSDQIQKLQQLATSELGMTTQQVIPLVMTPGSGTQIRDTAEQIYRMASAQHGLFYSNGLVCKLFQAKKDALPTLIPLLPATARSEFEKFVRFGKPGDKNGAGGVVSEADAKAILLCDNAKDLLPNITALLNRPLPVLHNGKIEILQAGYNTRTGYLVAAGTVTEPETVEQAVDIIESIFTDFSFQTDSDLSRAIACFLTPAMKIGGFIKDKTPVYIIEANESQTGKGFFLHLRDLLYGEDSILIARQRGGVGSVDETFGDAVLSGRPFIQFDNVRGELKSELLESFVTNPATLLVRTPYAKSQQVDGSLRFVSLTSNSMETTEDLANRACFVHLQKEKDRDFTTVNGATIDEIVSKAQHHFMGAVAKVLRHYHEQGMPKTAEKRHDFREWAQKLDWIVQHIFKRKPLMDGHEQVQQRVQNPALAFVRLVAIQVEKAGRLGDSLTTSQLADMCSTGGVEIPGLNKKGGAGYTGYQEAQRMGQLFSQAFGPDNEAVIDAYRIIRSEQLGLSSGGNSHPSKRYVFRREDEPAEPAVDYSI